MEVLKQVNERLRRQGYGTHLSLSQIEEQIDLLSEEEWSELLEYMENQLEDYDPEPRKSGGWY